MLQIALESEQCLSDKQAAEWAAVRLRNSNREVLSQNGKLKDESGVVRKPDGSILAVLMKGVLDQDVCRNLYELLRTVPGDISNRPSIIAKEARQPEIVLADGSISPRVSAKNVWRELDKEGIERGNSDFLGFYRYKNQTPGVPHCDLTDWTKQKPAIFAKTIPFIKEVDGLYRKKLPTLYARQSRYVNTIKQRWRIKDTAFTTLYVLRNWPTAVHKDTFDIKEGYGVMTTLGDFRGGELCFPQYKVMVDYRPGDLFLGDVHEWHGNFPLLEGERVSCVFFCRKGQHKCPA